MRDESDFSRGKRGPVIPPDPNKIRITIRLDADIIDYFKGQVQKAVELHQDGKDIKFERASGRKKAFQYLAGEKIDWVAIKQKK